MLQKQMDVSPDKTQYWQAHVDAWRASRVSQREYCNRYGLALSTFSLWRRRLAAGTPTRLEIVPIHRAVFAGVPPAVIVVAGGRYRVEIADGIQAETLRTILDTVEGR